MNVTGPSSSFPSLPLSSVATPSAKRSTPSSSGAPANAEATNASAASEAPAGVEPALWRVLTSEEKQFFQQMNDLGPLSYGARSTQPQAQAPVGQRIDVRA